MNMTHETIDKISENFGANEESPVRQTAGIILELLNKGEYPLLLGDRGLGKTGLSEQIIRAIGREMYYLNASQVDAASLVYPLPNAERDSVTLLTIKEMDRKTILLDELTNARDDLKSLLQSLVLDKRIGTTQFEDINFIATGNGLQHSSLANSLPRPLLERFCVVDFPAPTVDDWITYMLQTHSTVPSWYYGFMKSISSSEFYSPEDKGESENFQQRPSPRSHTKFAKILSEYESPVKALSRSGRLESICKGFLGAPMAVRFLAYLADSSNFLTYEEFLKGKNPQNSSQAINLILSANSALNTTVKTTLDNYIAYKSSPKEYNEKEVTEKTQKLYDTLNHLLGVIMSNGKTRSLSQFFLDVITRNNAAEYKHLLSSFANKSENLSSPLNKLISERRKAVTAVV